MTFLLFYSLRSLFDVYRQKQGRNEFVMRLQPKEAMYMKLTVCFGFISVLGCSVMV